jgi:hypothetical protein
MIGDLCRRIGDRLFSPVNTACARWGVRKGEINALCLATGVLSGAFYALALAPGGWILLVCHGFFDYLDGGTRRTGLRNQQEPRIFGLDTHVAVDKLGEVAVFSGLAFGGIASPWLAVAALGSSLIVTAYGRLLSRRGQAYPEHSIFDRADRVLAILIIGPLAGYEVSLIAVVLMNGVIIGQRVWMSTGSGKRPERRDN